MTEDLRVISADSHTMEPGDLWVERVDEKLRDQAPRVVKNEDRPGYSFVAPGIPASPISGAWAIGKTGAEMEEHLKNAGPEDARPGGWDPAERLKDMDIDGLEAEVLYGTLGMRIYRMDYPELQHACFKAYNDWLIDFCSYDPKRLHGLACVALWDVQAGVAELERCADKGLKGAMIWGWPPDTRRYFHPMYDDLWAAAQDLQMPLAIHVVTGMGEESRVDFSDGPMRYMNLVHEIQRSVSDMVLGGVFERFPGLKVIAAEADTGWLPHFMQRLDRANEKFGVMLGDKLSMLPSEYVKRNVWVTFLDDRVGATQAGEYGAENFMWGSDYPHGDSTWPNSREVIERNFSGLDEDTARRICFDNAAELYRIDL